AIYRVASPRSNPRRAQGAGLDDALRDPRRPTARRRGVGPLPSPAGTARDGIGRQADRDVEPRDGQRVPEVGLRRGGVPDDAALPGGKAFVAYGEKAHGKAKAPDSLPAKL